MVAELGEDGLAPFSAISANRGDQLGNLPSCLCMLPHTLNGFVVRPLTASLSLNPQVSPAYV